MGDPLVFRPATAARWRDLVELFGPRGACAGCWCMWWRLAPSRFERGQGAGNRRALKGLVASGSRPGILAYAGGRPVGWCALAPRDQYLRLDRSRVLARPDARTVWSVTCFYVRKDFRRRGVTVALLKAAVEEARRRGARLLEGYPLDPGGRRNRGDGGGTGGGTGGVSGALPDLFAWTGLASAFRKAGFREVLRRSPTRPIMRRAIRQRPVRRGGRAG